MKLYEFPSGDTVHKYKKSIVISFKGKRNVLSTGPNNGGFTTDLAAVFNNDANPGDGMEVKLRADTYREHMDILAKEDLGLDPSSCSGLMTGASMDNSAISTLAYDDFSVTSIATAGVRNNGGRIGDPASWHEKSENTFEDTTSSDTKKKNPIQNLTKNILGKNISGKIISDKDKLPVGTINILLYIDADLSKEALASALVSCTEAKHSKLGELIGRTVISSIKEALKLQQGITPQIQHDIIHRMDRFGVTEDALWDCYKETYRNLIRAEFTDILDRIRTDDTLVTYTSLYAHLLDQLSWGLLSFAECRIAANELLKLAVLHPDAECGTENIIQNYILAIADRIHRESLKKK